VLCALAGKRPSIDSSCPSTFSAWSFAVSSWQLWSELGEKVRSTSLVARQPSAVPSSCASWRDRTGSSMPSLPSAGPSQVLRYLGRYTHRVAISNHRRLAFDGERVSFRWRDYAHSNQQRVMTLSATEFLRRFLHHVLPRGFVRLRNFGYLSNARRSALLALARQRLAFQPKTEPARALSDSINWRCPHCGAPMMIGLNLTSQELMLRCNFFDTS